jgi:hypothetical protein
MQRFKSRSRDRRTPRGTGIGCAAPAGAVSHTALPDGGRDPPGGNTTSCDWFADGDCRRSSLPRRHEKRDPIADKTPRWRAGRRHVSANGYVHY